MTRSTALLLCAAALIASCDRRPQEQPRNSVAASPATLKASDAACRLPLQHFYRGGHRQLTGSVLGYPLDLLLVDGRGRFLWNGTGIGPRLLEEYLETVAASSSQPAPLMRVGAEPDVPCAKLQQLLSTVIRIRKCHPRLCTFEWVPSA